MTDHYSLVEAALLTKLRTLTSYFPVSAGKSAGWQVSDDDAVFSQGADYFIIARPGPFNTQPRGLLANAEWHVNVIIYVRYTEYKTSWARFKTFRSDIFNLLYGDPTLGKTSGVWNVAMSSASDAGRLLDTQGNPTNWLAQALDITISQRIKIRA